MIKEDKEEVCSVQEYSNDEKICVNTGRMDDGEEKEEESIAEKEKANKKY